MSVKVVKEGLTRENIISILKFLGSPLMFETQDFLVFNTVCHNLDGENGSPKLYYYYNTKLFICYTECEEPVDVYSLVEKVMKMRGKQNFGFRQSFELVLSILDINITSIVVDDSDGYQSETYRYEERGKVYTYETTSPAVLNAFSDFYAPEWVEEGISENTMTKYGIKFSVQDNKIIIPHFNIDGEIIGIRGRAMCDREIEAGYKYMPVSVNGSLKTHPISYNLYGANFSKDAIKKGKTAIVFEGEKSVMKLDSLYGDYNYSVAVCGNQLHTSQIYTLVNLLGANNIIVAFDKEYTEPYGKDGEQYLQSIIKKVAPYKHLANFSVLFDTKSKLESKDAPIDKGEEVFEEMLYNRVNL